MAPVRFEMACGLPFQIKFVDILCILGFDKFGNKLELLSKAKNSLFEDGYFLGCPFLEDKCRCYWVDQDVQVSFLVQVVDGVEIKLYRFFLFFRVGFINVILWLNYLKDRMFLESKVFKELDVCMIITLTTYYQDLFIDLLEIWLRIASIR
jgi:hypothetical protein